MGFRCRGFLKLLIYEVFAPSKNRELKLAMMRALAHNELIFNFKSYKMKLKNIKRIMINKKLELGNV